MYVCVLIIDDKLAREKLHRFVCPAGKMHFLWFEEGKSTRDESAAAFIKSSHRREQSSGPPPPRSFLFICARSAADQKHSEETPERKLSDKESESAHNKPVQIISLRPMRLLS